MDPLLQALVAAGIIDQATAERISRQMDPAAARTWAEAEIMRTTAAGLDAQQQRLVEFLRRNQFYPGDAAWARFWRQEEDLLFNDLITGFRAVATEQAAARAIVVADSRRTWELLNEAVDEWVNTYYTSPALADVGSVPNLCATARQQVTEEFLRWTRGGRDWQPDEGGLPALINALETTFGRTRAENIAATETTRIFVQGNRIVDDADEFVTEYVWLTSMDELVCPVCGPMNNRTRPKGQLFYQGPMGELDIPAHPRCRCDETPVTRLSGRQRGR